MTRRTQLFLMMTAVAGLCQAHVQASEPAATCPLAPSCGSQVLQRAFDHLGLADDERASRALARLMAHAAANKGLNSLDEIKRAAEAAGLRTAALQVRLEALPYLTRQGVVIANVTGNMHFCLITDVGERGVSIYDPGLDFTTPTISSQRFRESWDGRVLVVSPHRLSLKSLHGQVRRLDRKTLRSVLGGQPCENISGGGGSYSGGGGGGGWSRGNGPGTNSSPSSVGPPPPTTTEPVQLTNGNLFLEVADLAIPTRGRPLEFTRYYNAQTTSEVSGWLPEPGAGTWVVENGEYSGQGNRSASELIVQDFTLNLDMQTIQPGINSWEVARLNVRYAASPTDPRAAYNGYYFLIHTDGKLELTKWNRGVQNFLTSKPSSYRPTTKHRITIQAQGANIKISVNGNVEINYTDPTPLLSAGRVALEADFSHVHFDNVSITTSTSTATYDFSTDDNEFILGHGWTHSYSLRLREYPNHVTLIRENNAREIYVLQPDGTYQSVPVNTYTTLTKDASGFSVKTKYGLHYRCDLAGRLQYIEDRNLNRTTLTHGTIAGKTVLTNVTEPAGRTLTFSYGPNAMVSTITDPAGTQLIYSYDAAGHLTTARDRLGDEERYVYDPTTHNLIELIDKVGNRYRYTYTYNDRINDQTDPLGNRTTFDYLWDTIHVINQRNDLYSYTFDSGGFLKWAADPANNGTQFENDANGNVTKSINRNGARTSFTYDANGNRIGIYDALERWTLISYHPLYNVPTSITDPRGNVTTFAYDARGNLRQRTDPMGGSTTYTYNAFGQVLSATDPNGHTTTFAYDAYGNLASTTNPLGHTTTLTSDILGRRTGISDALGSIAQYTYDANGQVLSAANGLNQTMRYTYTPNAHLKTITDPLGNVTSMTHDCFGNILTVTDAKGAVTRSTYDTTNQMQLNRANRLTLTDANNHTTTYQYNALDRRVREADAAGAPSLWTYDGEGNLLTRTDANTNTTTYHHDWLNRLTGIAYPDSTNVTYTLDPVGNLNWVADPATSATSFTYDALSRPTQKVFPDGTAFESAYDRNGNRIRFTAARQSGSWTTTFSYDALNRLTQILAPDGRTTRFSYDVRSRRTRLEQPNGVTTTYTYDGADRLASFTTQSPTALIAQGAYTYDANGRRTQVAFTTGPTTGTLNYSYDLLNQLIQESGTLNGQAVSTTYAYDPLGNRTQRVQNGATTTYSSNALNQVTAESSSTKMVTVSGTVADANLASVTVNGIPATLSGGTFTAANILLIPGPNTLTATVLDKAGNTASHQTQVTYQPSNQTTYDYDMNGNRTIRRTPSVTETFTYDAHQRLQFFANGSTTWAWYTYNGLGERVAKMVNGITTTYYLDGPDIALETTGSTTTFYLHGPGVDAPLSRTVGSLTHYYHQDALGSVLALTDASGTLLKSYAYEPFGTLRQQTGSLTQPWTFTGRPFEVESGLHFLRARYYDSRTGTFLTRDPIGVRGGLNLYAYVQNNPLNLTDPFGLLTVHYWDPESRGKGKWHGHVSVHLDDGTYISYWPEEGIKPPFGSADPILPPTYQHDFRGEGERSPEDIRVEGLDETAIKAWWNDGRGHGDFSLFCNCSDIVTEALRAGGAQMPRYLIHDPPGVRSALQRYLESDAYRERLQGDRTK